MAIYNGTALIWLRVLVGVLVGYWLTDQEKEHATGLIRMLRSGAPAIWWPEAKNAWFSQEFIDRVEGMMNEGV